MFLVRILQIRGTLVSVLEVLGKWSLIDMYVLCIMTIAFPVTVKVLVDVNVFVEVCVNLNPY
jgi:uncharacterized paraquat-inducible protein A